MPQLRVLLGFAAASDHSLEETAQSVIDSLYGNSAYPDPPVTKPALETALADFSAAIAAAHTGGPQETADKNNKRAILIGLLRLLATYVQGKHGNNLATLLSSGFETVSINIVEFAFGLNPTQNSGGSFPKGRRSAATS